MSQPPPRGSLAPTITVLDSVTGLEIEFAYPATGFTMILFLRGTWCIYCGQQLKALEAHLDSLKNAGFRIACISPESPGTLNAYKTKMSLNVPLFTDTNRTAAKAFGVHYWLRYDGFNLAHPSLFIMGPDGQTLVSYVSKSMSDLPVGHLLEKFLSFIEQPLVENTDAEQ
ncbi:MAG: peroxiredoxin-like family protein [Armatimonadota bacterium]